MDIETLLSELERLRIECGADLVKVYYTNPDDYCIKFIKGDHIIQVIRRGKKRK